MGNSVLRLEFYRGIQNLKSGKGPGVDEIPTESPSGAR